MAYTRDVIVPEVSVVVGSVAVGIDSEVYRYAYIYVAYL